MGPVSAFVLTEVLGKVFDATAGAPIRALLKKRLQAAREVMLEEARGGRSFTTEQDLESGVAMVLRYLRAAEEGAARRNLRLMARVMSGMAESDGLYADEFLRWADIIASLSREEIVVATTLLQMEREQGALGTEPGNIAAQAMITTVDRLVGPGKVFSIRAELDQSLASLTRTGLVVPTSGWGGIFYLTTPRMAAFANLSDLETMFNNGGLD